MGCSKHKLLHLLVLQILLLFHFIFALNKPKDFSIQLVGSGRPHEGFLEVFKSGSWRQVIKLKWDIRNTIVVCRQLGYESINPDSKRSSNYISDFQFIRKNFLCQGSENSIEECRTEKISLNQMKIEGKLGNEVWLSCSAEKEKGFLKPKISKSSEKVKNLPVRLWDPSTVQDKPTARGVLEIKYKNRWHQVCADGWTKAASAVACGQLGYSNHNKQDDLSDIHFKVRSRHLMSRINCTGTELSLLSCDHAGFKKHFGCKKSVLLSCERKSVAWKERRVRLRGGQRNTEGRVEVFQDDRWGTVCDRNWDIVDANVVCRQLGFGSAAAAVKWAGYGQGSLPVLIDDVKCHGNESNILVCKHKRPDKSCKHYRDAGVQCNYPRSQIEKVRLIGGPSHTEGRVEVMHLGRWYGVCGESFSDQDAQVVCRELGLGFASRAFSTWDYGIRRIGLYEPRCSGDEPSILQCDHRPWFQGACRYYDMAAVKCGNTAPDILMDIAAMQSSIKINSWHLRDLTCSMSEGCLANTAYVRGAFSDPKANMRRLMVFTARILNKGTAAFRPNRHKDQWEWHACHAHYHSMEYFARYDVIDFHGKRVAEGHKASFCLEDTGCDDGAMKVFNCTDKGDQGISVGCADNYANSIDCQWVDVTDVKDGNYSLMVHLNPNRIILESDYENNIATCEVHYYNETVKVGRCSAEPCEKRSYGGTGYGMCCHFPFVYNGKTYHECITLNSDSPWCSTTYNLNQDNKWGYCNEIINDK